MKRITKQLHTGFTLVETLVAISIFTISILALFAVLSQGVSDTIYAKEKVTAAYLAEEGIEYVRNMRDTFALYDPTSGQNGWNSFISKLTAASCGGGSGCFFDDQNLNYTDHSQPMDGITVAACSSSCPTILYDSTTGKYGYASGTNSVFVRKITMTQISADEIKISSTVSWPQSSGNYSITFSEDLYNWIE